MSKAGDPRDGLLLRLNLETALNLPDPGPRLGAGLSYAATRAINSPLFQRLQEQIESNDMSSRVNEERLREINVTNIASESGASKADLYELFKNMPPGPPGPKGDPGDRGDPGDKGDKGDKGSGPGRGRRLPTPPNNDNPMGSFEPWAVWGDSPAGQEPGSGAGPGAGPSAAAPAQTADREAYRMNIQLQAEVEGLKEEMVRTQRQAAIALEVRTRMEAQNYNPRAEIIREFHNITQPQMVPIRAIPVAQDNRELIGVFERAIASNSNDFARMAQQMGMSIHQLVEHMKQRDQQLPTQPPTQPPPQPPPPPTPPPPPPTPPPAAAVQTFDIATPRGRSRSAVPEPVVETKAPVSRNPSLARDPSLASTADYRSRSRPKTVEFPTRAKSVERSSGTILPIAEEPRGRSPIRKSETPVAKRAIALLAQKQREAHNVGVARVHLGRFAKKFAAQREAPKKVTRDYDDIEQEIDEIDPLAGGVRKKVMFPAGAFMQRQRVDSEGQRRLRFEGQLVK